LIVGIVALFENFSPLFGLRAPFFSRSLSFPPHRPAWGRKTRKAGFDFYTHFLREARRLDESSFCASSFRLEREFGSTTSRGALLLGEPARPCKRLLDFF
jgi:hypothetical protein